MKILTAAMAALLMANAPGLRAYEMEPTAVPTATEAELKVKSEERALDKDVKALNEERVERNESVQELREDKEIKANAETDLQRDKEQGNAAGMKKAKKAVKKADKAVAGAKKDLASEQLDVNKAKSKVRKSAKRLKKAKVEQKAEAAE